MAGQFTGVRSEKASGAGRTYKLTGENAPAWQGGVARPHISKLMATAPRGDGSTQNLVSAGLERFDDAVNRPLGGIGAPNRRTMRNKTSGPTPPTSAHKEGYISPTGAKFRQNDSVYSRATRPLAGY